MDTVVHLAVLFQHSLTDQYQTLKQLFLKTAVSVTIGPDIAYKSDLESGVVSSFKGSTYLRNVTSGTLPEPSSQGLLFFDLNLT